MNPMQPSPPKSPEKKFFSRTLAAFGLVATLGVAWVGLSGSAPFASSFGDIARHLAAVVPGAKKVIPQGYKNWGLINDQGRSHINAVEAWKITEGSRNVLVAVIDTGLDSSHPDLRQNVWAQKDVSSGSSDAKRGRGLTSKFSKDVYGWDFVRNQPNPADNHGHGTHVAGIIGAVANPITGVSGVAHQVSIMSVKYYSDSNPGPVNLNNTVRAIHYAIDHGARIINYSGGGPEFSREEYLAIKRAEAQGILFVAAAGNEHQNTDAPEHYYYPSAYGLSNILSVAATDINNNLLASSNWGKTKVEVAAPGENIYSTLPGGRYGYMSGTSQATAFVSGIAALLLSKNPSLTPAQVKRIIMDSVDKLPQLENKVATGGRVNALAALTKLQANLDPSSAPAVTPAPEKKAPAKKTIKRGKRRVV